MDFHDYIGKKVNVTESEHELELKALGLTQKFIQHHVDENDPVINEITSKHSNVRVWTPSILGTADWQPTRLNVYVDKNDAGDYVITDVRYG